MADQASRRERPAPEVGARVRAAHVDAGLSLRALALGPGDAVAFGSETPHRFRSLGDEPVTAVWLNVRARV